MDDKSYHQANVVTPEEYGRKRAQIEAARAYLEQMECANEAGRETYEADLLKKIREGDEARQRLFELGHYRNPMATAPLRIEAGPSSARIEEIPTSTNLTANVIQWNPPENQDQSSSQSRYHQQSNFPTQMAPTTWPSSHYNYGQQQQQVSAGGNPIRQPSYAQNYAPGIRAGPPPPPVSQLSQPPGYYRRNYEYHSSTDNLRQSNTQKPPPSKSSSKKSHRPTASNGIHGSGMTHAGANRTSRQDPQKPVHYTPTGVRPVGTSSLTGALGQTQISQSGQTSTPETAYKPKTAQVPAAVAGPSNQGMQNAVKVEELEDRKARVLAFRSSVLEWARTAPPNTYTEFFSVKAHKGPDSVLYIISRVNGQEQMEQHDTFFERLWIMAGLSPNTMPFKQTSTTQQLADKVSAGPPPPPTEPPTLMKTPNKPATGPVLPKNGVGLTPPVGASQTNASPSTPRQQTLVDPASGKWRSPADADKKRLARDVIYALGKRKQDNQSGSYSKPAKRQALEAPAARNAAPEPVEHMSRVLSGVSQGLKQLNESLAGAGGQTVRPDVVPAALPTGSIPIQPVQQQQQFEATASSSSTPGRLQANSAPLPTGAPAQPNMQKPQTAESTSISTLQDSNGSGSKAVSLPEPSHTVPSASQANATLPASLQASGPAIPVKPSTNTIRAVPNTAMFREFAVHPSTSTNDARQQLKPSFFVMKLPVGKPNPAPSSQASVVLPSTSKTMVNDVDMTPLNPDASSNVLPSACDLDSLEPLSSKSREPLFLPSPSSSPLPLTVTKEKKKQPSVYVLVPPPPDYLIRYRKQQARKAEKAEGRSSKGRSCTSSVVSTSVHSRSSEGV